MVAGVSAAFVFVEVWGSISGTAGWRKGLSHKFQGVSAINNSLSAQMSTGLCFLVTNGRQCVWELSII